MKLTSMLLALAGAVILTGCDTPSVLSLEPLVTAEQATFDPTLLGAWEAAKGDDLCIFRRDGDTGYSVTYISGDSAKQFDALLFRVGEALVLDLSPSNPDDFQVAGHALVRIWTEGGGLRWTFLDSDWLRGQAAPELARRPIGDKKLLLTAPAAAIRNFLAKYGVDDRAHGEIKEWRRLQ